MPSKEEHSLYYKWFVVCIVFAVIGVGLLLSAIWIATGDDTGRFTATAALVGIPAVVGAAICGIEEWGD